MWNRFTKLLLSSNKGNSSNNNKAITSKAKDKNQSANPVALLITGKIPDFILTLPLTCWMTPLSKKADNTVGSYLTSRDKRVLSQAKKPFYLFYTNEFEKQRPQINTLFNVKNDQPFNSDDLKDDLKKLLSHIALGEFEQAEEIWKKDPALLTHCGTVYHPNRIYDKEGKVIADIPVWQNPGRPKYRECTAWQIALMNSEFEEAEEMGKTHDGS